MGTPRIALADPEVFERLVRCEEMETGNLEIGASGKQNGD